MSKIKNKNLQKIITHINSTKYKKKSLEKLIKEDSDFKEFINEILSTLGYLKDNQLII